VQLQRGGSGAGGHRVDDPVVAVPREEGGEVLLPLGAVGGEGDGGKRAGELVRHARAPARGVAHEHHLAGPRDRRHDVGGREVLGAVDDEEVDVGAGREHLAHQHRGDDPDGANPGEEGGEAGAQGADVGQVRPGELAPQLLRGRLVPFDGAPEPAPDGAAHRAGEGLHLRAVEGTEVLGETVEGGPVVAGEIAVGPED